MAAPSPAVHRADRLGKSRPQRRRVRRRPQNSLIAADRALRLRGGDGKAVARERPQAEGDAVGERSELGHPRQVPGRVEDVDQLRPGHG